MARGTGTRPWKRGTEAQRAANSTVLPDGDLAVTDEGNVYAGFGGTLIKNLKRLVRLDEVGAIAAASPEVKAAFPSLWKTNVDYVLGDRVTNPDGQVVTALSNHGSGATYNPAMWTKPALTSAARQALAAAVLARFARPDGDKVSLYTGTAPVISTSSTSTISGGVMRTPRRIGSTAAIDIDNDPNFRYGNTTGLGYGASFPDNQVVRAPLLTGGSANAAYFRPRLGFYYDGSAFEFYGKALVASPQVRLRIDGKLVTAGLTPLGTGLSAGSLYYWKVDLGSQAHRLIEIDYASAPAFGGIVIEPTASIHRGPLPTLRVAALTDSIGAGSGEYSHLDSWVGVLAELMGADIGMANLGIGGTGYTTAAGVSDYITRVPDVVAMNPDIVIVQGEQNDGGTPAALQTAASTLLTALSTALPQAMIVVMGAYSASTPDASKALKEAALRAAATAAGAVFVSWIDPLGLIGSTNPPTWAASTNYPGSSVVLDPNGVPQTCITGHTSTGTFDQTKWRPTAPFYGSGRVGSTTGDGNADVMLQAGAGNVHPTLRGSVVLGRRAYQGIRANLRRIAATGTTGIIY